MYTVIRLGLSIRGFLCVLLLLNAGTVIAQDIIAPVAVGRVVAIAGDVDALNEKRATRSLQFNSEIYEGDVLKTNAAKQTQIRFKDGALITLRAGTSFKIQKFKYNPDDDSEGVRKSVFELLEGGFRTISGQIGKEDEEDYEVLTPVATVGIRGTHYGLRLCKQAECSIPGKVLKPGLYAGVVDGSIAVTNEKGVNVFDNDEYVFVLNNNSKPRGLFAPPGVIFDDPIPLKIVTAVQQQARLIDPELIVLGHAETYQLENRLNQDKPGVEQVVLYDGGGLDSRAPAGSAAGIGMLGIVGSGFFQISEDIVTKDSNPNQLILLGPIGEVMAARDKEPGVDLKVGKGMAALQDAGGDPVLNVTWGRWAGNYVATQNGSDLDGVGSLHYITAPNATTISQLNNLGFLGSSVTFNYMGGPKPTDHNGTVGSIVAASTNMTVDFVSRDILSYNIMANVAGSAYSGSLSGGPLLFNQALNNGLDLVGTCTGACGGVAMDGHASLSFVGNQAEGAISAFGLTESVASPSVGVTGAVYLRR